MYNIYSVKKEYRINELLGGWVLPFHSPEKRRDYIRCLCTITDNNSQQHTVDKKITELFWPLKKNHHLVLGGFGDCSPRTVPTNNSITWQLHFDSQSQLADRLPVGGGCPVPGLTCNNAFNSRKQLVVTKIQCNTILL